MTKNHKLLPIHPGEILLEEFLKPAKITQSQLAIDLNVSFRRINEICRGKREISVDTTGRLAIYFGLPEYFWLDLQQRYDYLCWEAKKRIAKREVKPLKSNNSFRQFL
jgi:addiction module HigA family antidote